MNSTSTARPENATAAPLPAGGPLAVLRRRARAGIWIEGLGLFAALLVAFALPSFVTDRLLRLEWIVRALLLGTFVATVARVLQLRLVRPLAVPLDDDELALAVERSAPLVKQALISSMQFDRELRAGAVGVESPALKAAVVADVRARLGAIPFAGAIDAARVRRHATGLLLALVVFGGWAAIDQASLGTWAARNLALRAVDWPRFTALALVGEQTVRLPQGDALTVRVDVRGPVPDQVFVDYRFAGGERGTEPMSRTGEREFAWTLEAVLGDVQLELQGGDSLPLVVDVTVVERPRIDRLSLHVTYPEYMERDPEHVPPTEGELRLPKGAVLAIAGESHKPLAEAFALFAEQKEPLSLEADGRSFAGRVAPLASGLLVVDVVDTDRLGAGAPPKWMLRVGDDKPPTVEFRLRGIGASITAHARIPGELRVRDDFGLRAVGASWRAVADRPPEPGMVAPPDAPFAPAVVAFGGALERSALRYDTTAQVDLQQWNRVPEENAADNPIRPGMLFSLRFAAVDNFGPGDPHEGVGETVTFRVVTRERLTEELRRRQVEQRTELQRIADDLQRATLELAELPNPAAAAGDRARVEGRLRAIARGQQALGRRVAFVGESYQRVLWEYENNRLWEGNKVRAVEALIPAPLQALAREAFPAIARSVEAFAGTAQEAARADAVDGCREAHRRILAVLKQMEQAENLAALIEELRSVIRLEQEAIRDVEGRVRTREQDIFQPRGRK